MKNIIITCNTYYQLIMAVQLKRTLKRNDNITLILSDQSDNAGHIAERLEKLDLFEKVCFIENREFIKKQSSRVKAAADVYWAVTGNTGLYSFLPKGKVYDELIFYNPDTATHCLFAILDKGNKNMTVSRYEEGLISYGAKFDSSAKMRSIYGIRKMFGKRNLLDSVTKFYCVHPEFYQGDKASIKIPEIRQSDTEFISILGDIFEIDRDCLRYDARYIFFSSIFDVEGNEPAGELELIRRIAELVGKDSLLVKVHPRDNVRRFTEIGLKVDARSSVPWEIIQLNYDFSKHVFLTACSTSVITISAITEKAPKIYFLHKLCKGNNDQLIKAARSVENIFKLTENKYLSSAYIVDTFDELRNLLKR